MNPEAVQPQQAPQVYMSPVQDKGVLIERTQFSEELKNLRIALTGEYWEGKNWIKIADSPTVCKEHFNKLLPKIFMANTKATTLSRVSRENVEMFVTHTMNNLEAWFIKNCYTCSECGIRGDYDTINEVMDALEVFFYFNFSRAVDGFEAEKLAQSHQSVEQTHRYSDERPSFLSLKNLRFGGGKG